MENDNTLQDVLKGERVFLHDISNQLVVSQGMGAFVLKKLIAELDPEDKRINRMEKSVKATNKIIEMVRARRDILHSLSDDV